MPDGYQIGKENGQRFIECATCGKRSFNQHDIEQRYCGNCHQFHSRVAGYLKPDPQPVMTMFTVYERPRDFPHSVVVRRWTITAGNEPVPDPLPYIVGPSLEAVREVLLDRNPALVRLDRDPNDEPQIVETWI